MNAHLKATSRLWLAGIIAIGFLVSPAKAASQADLQQMQAQIEAMQAAIKNLQRQVHEAQSQAASAKAASAASAPAASSSGGSQPDLKVKWKGAPEFSSSDGKFKMKIRGRVNVDAEHIDQDERITGQPDVSGAEIRRARLGIEGVVFYDVAYKFEMDFAGDTSVVKDAYLQYQGLPIDITIGHFKPYNSIEFQMSANNITFMERAALFEGFTIDRLIGLGLSKGAKHWTAGAGVFATAPEAEQSTFFGDGTTFSARVTAAPVNEPGRVVHLGASVRHRDGPGISRDGATDPLFRYRARGDDFHLASRFIDTGNIGKADTFWDLEAAWVLGPFSMQAEYTEDKVDVPEAIAPSANPTYTGWYAEASVFLTGETRPYDDGMFGRVKVKNPVFQGSRGWGAWQVAGRYDTLDLSDQATAIAAGGVMTCALCGEQNTWLLGVNWYLNDYTRLMLNLSQSEIKGGDDNGADIKGVGMRAQVDW
jgi:phosphate-selective porin OprO/OprP